MSMMLAAVSMSTGCRLAELFDGTSVATVKVFATRAGTPSDDLQFPDHGDAGSNRVFVNDMGWQVSLDEAYVTTAEVDLVRCASEATPLEMFWGPCAEDFVITDDRTTLALGAVTVDDGDFCRLDVTFAPYMIVPESEQHVKPSNPAVEGNTVYIVGVARMGEGDDLVEVPFEVITAASVTAELDLSEIDDNRPLHLEDELYPRDLTVLKTYDTFFEGVDFATASPAEIEAAVLSALELDTRVYNGARV
ncbi:hypothetical protein G6O69_30150 [Pseudenhygromyxa sp. WMMC2535]|uniref:hypothetical protein n=1 Tax=Pseudenhygromyxa sp. WMMC2535 TaxID=2712867 RepID=UPI0015568897|nr:hypothetical protein [Pseudenhygromyxa sp. WMMC2535]NVB42124.1 hypothetical protein [Pseudenhygromyxa sp. WMMC2535]